MYNFLSDTHTQSCIFPLKSVINRCFSPLSMCLSLDPSESIPIPGSLYVLLPEERLGNSRDEENKAPGHRERGGDRERLFTYSSSLSVFVLSRKQAHRAVNTEAEVWSHITTRGITSVVHSHHGQTHTHTLDVKGLTGKERVHLLCCGRMGSRENRQDSLGQGSH